MALWDFQHKTPLSTFIKREKQTKTFETKRTRGNEVWSLILTCKPCSARISYPWVSKSEPQRIPVLLKSSNAIYQVASPLKRVLFREPSLVYCSFQNDELTIFLLFFFFFHFLRESGLSKCNKNIYISPWERLMLKHSCYNLTHCFHGTAKIAEMKTWLSGAPQL